MKVYLPSTALLSLTILFCGTAQADDGMDGRWVHIPENPSALLHHFGMKPMNCYELAHPEEAAIRDVTRLSVYNLLPGSFEVGEGRTDYDIDLAITFDGKEALAFGQCFTSENRIKCGVACDSGHFQFYDVDQDTMIVEIGGISEACDSGNGTYYDPSIYGRLFRLTRMDNNDCAALLGPM